MYFLSSVQLYVWTQPVMKYCEHTVAVKAIAWSPHLYRLLASGGGTTDECIRFWNTTTNSHLRCINTGSQVCNLIWSKNVNELVSTHGYCQNHILVWRYSTMSKLATLKGHEARVLYPAISPDGKTIVTGARDETLRFWNVFPSPRSQIVSRGKISVA
ncbi:putative WD-repeat protein [Heracleum sosnowskyi]|uniref:WD-repeat protein n=1 Tax=Heracleum sosnowskyi TaxID=360622 RepID=A0AAD8IS48_9APIA|nr:putative WD-repeat protein [Heracleum sosnowskyi]